MKDDNNNDGCDGCGGCDSPSEDMKQKIEKISCHDDWKCSYCGIQKKINNRILNFSQPGIEGHSVCNACIDDNLTALQDGELTPARDDQICSFCHKGKREEVSVYTFQSALYGELYECEECIVEQKYKIEPGAKEREDRAMRRLLSPKKIREILDKYVIGQDEAKIVLANAIHSQGLIIAANKIKPDSDDMLERDNILIIGPTGCGKTLLLDTIRKCLDKIVVSGDANTFSEAGYIGGDIENLFTSAIEQANGNIEVAQGAIIHIDEVDKIAEKSTDNGDVSRLPVQQALLTPLQGTKIYVPKGFDAKSSKEKVEFDTSQVLFIASGSFSGLREEIIKKKKNKACGFGAEINSINLTPEELVELIDRDSLLDYGLAPEFLGRLHLIVVMTELTIKQYHKVLTDPKNSLVWQWTKKFSLRKKQLEFDDEALWLLAKKAKETKSGARALRGMFLEFTKDVYHEMEDDPDNVVGYRLTVDSFNRGTLDKIVKKSCDGKCGDDCCQKTGGDCCGGNGHDDDEKKSASR